MAQIEKIAVFGASGSVGSHIIDALLASRFEVTIITRSLSSTTTYPMQVQVKETDYSTSSLKDVLIGHDAVVSCIARTETDTEIRMIDAAEAVGVQRFIPSDFGADLGSEEIIPEYKAMHEGKGKVLDYLKERAAMNQSFTWTSLVPGPFFDYFLYAIPFISFDIQNHAAVIYDSGNAPWAGTTLSSVGKAVANILKAPEQAANRVIKTKSLRTTQNEILASLEKTTGKDWEVKNVSAEDTKEKGREFLREGKVAEAYGNFFAALIWEDGFERGVNVGVEGYDNEVAGVKEEKLDDIVARVVKMFGPLN